LYKLSFQKVELIFSFAVLLLCVSGKAKSVFKIFNIVLLIYKTGML